MLLEEEDWTDWVSVSDVRQKAPGGQPGCYVVALNGRPIHRLCGADMNSIIYVGHTNDLGKRLITFLRAVQGKRAHHMGGIKIASVGLLDWLPNGIDDLFVRWCVTDSKSEAGDLERRFLTAYLVEFLEMPPYNGALPKDR